MTSLSAEVRRLQGVLSAKEVDLQNIKLSRQLQQQDQTTEPLEVEISDLRGEIAKLRGEMAETDRSAGEATATLRAGPGGHCPPLHPPYS